MASRHFSAWLPLLRKVLEFGVEHGPLTYNRLGAPEVVAVFTSRELTALKEFACMRDPNYRYTFTRPFEYNAMALRDLLIGIDAIAHGASAAEIERVRNAFRRAATSLLEEMKLAEATARDRDAVPTE